MRKPLFILFAALLISDGSLRAKQKPNGTLSFSVIDNRKVIARGIDENLLLRAVKASSLKQADFGWDVEVVEKSSNESSFLNLLYHSPQWHGPHPSQVYAWHVGARLFRDERELEVRGHPYVVSIVLVNPVVEGEGLDRMFISGKIKVSWRRQVAGVTPPNKRLQRTRYERASLLSCLSEPLKRSVRLLRICRSCSRRCLV